MSDPKSFLDDICQELTDRLPKECNVWSEVISDELKHVVQSTSHSLGLVSRDEIERLERQLKHCKKRISELTVLISQLEHGD